MTITKERLLKIQHWRETYGADSNVMLPAEEAEELARIALAALEAEKGADPIVFTDERNLRHIARGRETSLIWGKQNQEVGDIPLYRHAQPVPVDKEFIPKNLDKALGVVGVALPESKEEFNFQIERWIQRLIDRVIRYADEFKEQPVPVVPEEWTIQDAVKFCRETGRQDAGSAMEAWNACRTAMLQGSQPVSNRDELPLDYLQGQKDGLEWAAQLAEANHPQTGDWLYDDPIDLAKAIRKGPDMLDVAGNSPVIPDGYADMLRRWLAFGRGMQSAGSQLPRNLIAETEAMIAPAPQQEAE
ncbi:DUF551 domain-containing protein [Salmonella enterica subsp. enterica serovar Corvallis]|nr:DUF551 domain-containing protein [Salmonella enterica subsp. enterica serovar Corvallis]ECY4202811.1 DUF551 domain-containing protein [Salmonella enterica subsp. enterica serovar Corvallis]